MKEISVSELKQKMDNKENFQLIDVREDYEVEIAQIGGLHIPMGSVLDNLEKIRKDVPVYVHCRSGKRSGAICDALEANGYTNVYNVAGGILAWSDEIDSSLPKY
jgi:rhodanese-related sulfurtransferase